MQRLSNAALYVALLVFVVAISLALIAAAWLMATHLLDGAARSSQPKWLLICFLALSINEATAQTNTIGTFVVVEERINQPNGQPTVTYKIDTTADTLPPPIRTDSRNQKRVISPKPSWSNNDPFVAEKSNEPDISTTFFIMAVSPNPSAYKTGYWFRSRP